MQANRASSPKPWSLSNVMIEVGVADLNPKVNKQGRKDGGIRGRLSREMTEQCAVNSLGRAIDCSFV